jgi:hypothetical protein
MHTSTLIVRFIAATVAVLAIHTCNHAHAGDARFSVSVSAEWIKFHNLANNAYLGAMKTAGFAASINRKLKTQNDYRHLVLDAMTTAFVANAEDVQHLKGGTMVRPDRQVRTWADCGQGGCTKANPLTLIQDHGMAFSIFNDTEVGKGGRPVRDNPVTGKLELDDTIYYAVISVIPLGELKAAK